MIIIYNVKRTYVKIDIKEMKSKNKVFILFKNKLILNIYFYY